jgi:hypothetical protein
MSGKNMDQVNLNAVMVYLKNESHVSTPKQLRSYLENFDITLPVGKEDEMFQTARNFANKREVELATKNIG